MVRRTLADGRLALLDGTARRSGAPSAVLPLIGRDQTLRGVAGAFHHVLDGARALVAIVGERGSGRTRALRECARLPELAGAAMLDVRLAPGSADMRSALARALHEKIVVRRALTQLRGDGIITAHDEQLATLLSSLGSVMPLVLLVDDLDAAAYAADLGALLSLVRVPWLLVATADETTATAATLAGRAADASVLELPCRPFDRPEIAALLRSMMVEEPAATDIAWLVERTGGLPLLVREALEAAIRAGTFVHKNGGLCRVDAIERADDTYSALLPHLVPAISALDGAAREALATLSLLGPVMPRDLALGAGIADGALADIVARGLVGDDGMTLRFAGRLAHAAALATARASRVDERCARTLVRIVPPALETGLGPPAHTLDLILREAGDGRSRVAGALVTAARRLVDRGEFARGADLMRLCYDEVLDSGVEPSVEAAMFEQYAIALYSIGLASEHHELIERYLARHDETTAPAELLASLARALVWLAEHCERRRHIDAAVALLDRADAVVARMAPGAVASMVQSRAMLGRARVYSVAERKEEAAAVLCEILAHVDADTQTAIAFDALLILGRTAQTDEQRAEAERWLAAMLERFEREGRDRLAVQLRASRIGMRIDGMELDELEPEIRSLIEQTRQWSLPRTESNAWVWLSILLADRGETDDALQAIDRAIEIRWRVGSIALWQFAMISRAQILVLAQRDDEALETIAQIEADARLHDRPCRRFLLETCLARIEIRRGEWLADAHERLAALGAIGVAERFAGTEHSMLEVEGELLLRTFSIDRDSAREYARRVLASKPAGLAARRLFPTALAVLARAHDVAVASRGRNGVSDPMLAELRRLVTETLSIWLGRRAYRNVAHALSMLRAHAPRALNADDLASVDLRMPSGLDGPSWHHCAVQTFGPLRVIDAAGNERGGRHFGQHKTDSKPKKLLSALSVAAILDRRLKRERLIDMVWGESVSHESAANNFHVTLSGLRQVVGDVVDFDGVSYTLNTRLVHVDAIRLIELVDEAFDFQRDGLLFRAYDRLREACALVHGEFLEGIYDEWTDGARDLVRAKVRAARLRVAEIALARAELDVVREEVAALLEADGFDEEAMYLQIAVLKSDGERLRAIREFDRFAARLAAEYGAQPSTRMRSLRASMIADV
jgi:DNA-binding SARP family transcriptional activator/tetratricopeptide (TPR) repeat protein